MSRGRVVGGGSQSKSIAAAIFVGLVGVVGLQLWMPKVGAEERKQHLQAEREHGEAKPAERAPGSYWRNITEHRNAVEQGKPTNELK
jgi:hypothetical protein